MNTKQGQIEGFAKLEQAAARVRARVAWTAFLTWMAAGRWLVPALMLLSVPALRMLAGTRGGEWIAVLVLAAAWTAAGGVRAFLARPRPLGALALWDERGGRHDLFASAWSFLGEAGREGALAPGRSLHVEKALAALPEAAARMRQDFPAPTLGKGWLLAVLALGLAFTPWLKPGLAPGEIRLAGGMTEEARRQAAALEREGAAIDRIAGLSEEEKKELESLRREVAGMAEELADSEGRTAREVLESLEARARAAERLAGKMGEGAEGWASEEMIREMSQHADTADLAAAVKDKAALAAAGESDKLAGLLGDADLKLETRERVTGALERTMGKATEDDLRRPVGERVGNASRKMEEKQPATAAREFEELAKHFRLIQEREEAEQKLRELAETLREAGNSIAGSQVEKMERLASSGQGGGQQPGGGESLQPLSEAGEGAGMAPMPPMPTPGTQGGPQQAIAGGQQMPLPGLQGAGTGEGPEAGQAMPVPGAGQETSPQEGAMAVAGQGQQPGPPGQGLMAPVPGQAPGAGAPGASLGAAQGAAQGASAPGAGGGNQAGTGTAALGDQATDAMKAAQDSQVAAQSTGQGESTVRAVEGQARAEAAQREAQAMMVDFLKVEQEALDEATLPLSRREHVLRYFSALREEFEKQD